MYYMFMGTMQIPIPPPTMRTKIKNRNKTIDLINKGEINVIKATGLTELSFKFMLPNADYPFNQAILSSGAKASYYLNQLETMKQSQDSFQFICVRMTDGGDLLSMDNIKVTLEDYTIDEDANEGYDFWVSVKLKQYREWGSKKLNVKTDADGNTTATAETTRGTTGKTATPSLVSVQNGDTLQTICKKYLGPAAMSAATGLPFIKKLNKIAIPAVLTVGQAIKMKDTSQQTTNSTNGGFINGTILY